MIFFKNKTKKKKEIVERKLSPTQIGNIGEDYIARYLKKNGYKIVERNMRNYFSEIDIIAKNKEYIIFVEVRTRSTDCILPPAAAVDYKKRRKIVYAVQCYLKDNSIKIQPRIDIAEVYLNKSTYKVERMNYIENAIGQGRGYAPF